MDGKIVDQIKQAGRRLTKARLAIVKVFEEETTPISANEVRNKLGEKKIEVNKTTIYRELEFLKGCGFLKEIMFGDGKTRYEKEGQDCHHHVICNKCGRVEDVNLREHELLKSIEEQANFSVQRHSIEFFGLCHVCR